MRQILTQCGSVLGHKPTVVAKEEHETDKEHESHKHEEEDVELCRPVWQDPLGKREMGVLET